MPLNLSPTGEGDFIPYLKYNAKAGRFYAKFNGAQGDVEINRPRLAIDMAHIKTGWLFYAEGSGPEKVWDPSTVQAAPRPAGPKKFKRGFEVMVFGGDPVDNLGPLGLREFSSTANNVISSILSMYAEYEAGMAANPGKVPFYGCDKVVPVNGAYGTNYEPQFRLIGWVDREKLPAFDEHLSRADDDAPLNAHQNGNGNGHDAGMSYEKADRRPMLDDEIPF